MIAAGQTNLVHLEVFLHFERPNAVLVSLDGERANAVWLPKEAVELNDLEEGKSGEITLPEDLAFDKGLNRRAATWT